MDEQSILVSQIARVRGPVPLVLVLGQSNALGQALVAQASESPSDGDAWLYEGDTGGTELYDEWTSPNNGTRFGPEWGAGIDYQAGYIKHAQGSTNLYNQWQPAGAIYLDAIDTIDAALSDLEDCTKQYEVKAVIWLQGEADALETQEIADAYEENLDTTAAAIRAAYGASIKWIVVGIIMDAGYADTVRSEQASFASTDGNAVYIDTSDLSTTDGIHFDTDSMLTIGKRCAAEIP